jgi:hypothetical protein
MTNENNENFDREDRDFYSEGQRISSDDSSSSQNENTPEHENKDNSLQNDFYRDPNKVDSDNNPNRRTLDEYNANKNEPDQDNGLENDDVDNSLENENSDPLDNDLDDDDLRENNLRDAFNNDDLDRRDQSDF